MEMTSEPKVVTFDCYGTLINWDEGPLNFFGELLGRKEAKVSAESFRQRWEWIQYGILQGPYQLYREKLESSLAQTLRSFGLRYEESDGRAFLESFVTWGPFSDVKPALQRLGARYKLGIISNTDNDLITRSIENIAVDFDQVTTAMDAEAYKPDLSLFELTLKRLSVSPSEVLHVFAGYKYDMFPASELGMRTMWINRKDEPLAGDAVPDYVEKDLGAVPYLLGL